MFSDSTQLQNVAAKLCIAPTDYQHTTMLGV